MSAVRSQVGVLPSPRSSSEKKDPGLRVFSGYSCVPIFIHTSSPALRCQTTYAAPPRDRHVVTKLPLALATKAKSQRAELLSSFALLCRHHWARFFFSLCPSGGGPCSLRGELACSCFAAPIYPYLAMFSVPRVLIYNTRTREAPCSSLGRQNGAQGVAKQACEC